MAELLSSVGAMAPRYRPSSRGSRAVRRPRPSSWPSPCTSIRLDGRAAIATGSALIEESRPLEQAHARGSPHLGAAWERARTELDVAEAFASAARSAGGADAALDAAKPDLERAGALIELERLRSRSGHRLA